MVSHIRQVISNDAELLSQLAIKSKAYWGYSEDFMQQCTEELKVTKEKINSADFDYNIYESNDELVGFYAIERLNETEAELEALFVSPEFIGKGIGKALIEHAITTAKKSGFKKLNVQGDPNAEKFYFATGAELVGQLESGSIKERFLPLFVFNL